MLLILDIGNTNIKSALSEGDGLKTFIVHSSIDKAVDYINKITFNEAAICSVNPSIEEVLVDTINKRGIKVFRANIQSKFNLKIKYETPHTLGMDRVCSVIGALDIATKGKLFSAKQYFVTIDFGTATTINIVNPAGEFSGGLIAPGISTMLKSLNEKTAQLPLPELSSYTGVIGNSTRSSIVNGVITATLGMINETIYQISKDSNNIQPLIFATGGNASFILPHLKHKIYFEEALVLKGLKVIYYSNRN